MNTNLGVRDDVEPCPAVLACPVITFTLDKFWTVKAGEHTGRFEVFDELTMCRWVRGVAGGGAEGEPVELQAPGKLALAATPEGWRLNGVDVSRPGTTELDAVKLSLLLADYFCLCGAAMPPAPPPSPGGGYGWPPGLWLLIKPTRSTLRRWTP